MRDTDVIQHIQDLCRERDWSYYRLAKESDIPYSTLNNMINRTNIPTIWNHALRFLYRKLGPSAADRRAAGSH